MELKQEVDRCTKELDAQRALLASDFHDETGNLLSVIIHQATLLKLKAGDDLQPIAENILCSSQQLYSSSKHFLWHLHAESGDPEVLFEHLANMGQDFCNKVDISFSANQEAEGNHPVVMLVPADALNLVFIFKEAMSNVARHAGATEMVLKVTQSNTHLEFELVDNGRWKEPDGAIQHFGLSGIKQRCQRNGFLFCLVHDGCGTRVRIKVPLGKKQAADLYQKAHHC